MSKKKKRVPVISPHFGKHVEIARLNLQDGILSFYDSKGERVVPTHAAIGDAYNRKSGKLKTINQVQTNGARIDLNPNATLEQFDWLFAIDTNYREYGGFGIAISCPILAQVSLSKPTRHREGLCQDWAAKVVPQAAFVFRNPQVNPELIGWRELINRVQQSSEFVS